MAISYGESSKSHLQNDIKLKDILDFYGLTWN